MFARCLPPVIKKQPTIGFSRPICLGNMQEMTEKSVYTKKKKKLNETMLSATLYIQAIRWRLPIHSMLCDGLHTTLIGIQRKVPYHLVQHMSGLSLACLFLGSLLTGRANERRQLRQVYTLLHKVMLERVSNHIGCHVACRNILLANREHWRASRGPP